MCGIVGYVGTKNVPGRAYFALDVVLEGLRRLEYRGYDSAGVAVLDEGKISFRKKAGKVAALDEVIAAPKPVEPACERQRTAVSKPPCIR